MAPSARGDVGRVTERSAAAGSLIEQSSALVGAARRTAGVLRRGGSLLVLGTGAAAADAAHVVVEFLHPVIVGKRALPALSLCGDDAGLAERVRLLAGADDVLLAVCPAGVDGPVSTALAEARRRGLLTVLLVATADVTSQTVLAAADCVVPVGAADPVIAKEVLVTTYHLLWETTHMFLDDVHEARAATAEPTATCTDDRCITCGDIAVEALVLRLLDAGLAVVDAGAGEETVSVALVDAKVGDHVLVHAGEALTCLGAAP